MPVLNKLSNAIRNPKKIGSYLQWQYLKRFGTPKQIASYLYKKTCGRKLNWENPEDLNQVAFYTSIYGDTSQWPLIADKIRVREYLKSLGLGEHLVKVYKVWDSPEDISFDELPDKFVLKMNNGSGDVTIVKDKNKISLEEVKKKYRHHFKHTYGKLTGEPHYAHIPAKVFAEEMLDSTNQSFPSTCMIDYKIWCINGEPEICMVCYNRCETVDVSYYSADPGWKDVRERTVPNDHFVMRDTPVPKPKTLDRMLEICRILSKDHPQTRVDFYEVDGKCYIGEITMTSTGNRILYFKPEYLVDMGNRAKQHPAFKTASKK